MTLDKQKLIDAMQEAANIRGYENEYCTGEMMEFALAALQDYMPPVRYFIIGNDEKGNVVDRELFFPFGDEPLERIWNDATVNYLALKNLGR
mgnify:FL=1